MVGSQVSRYHILARIGEGGMGEVYLAEDPSLARRLALKFLPASLAAEDSARQRLLNEAQAAARLDHPFVCKVYEVGEAGGHPYIAMEFVDGMTLRQRLSSGPLSIKDALRIATEVAEALDSAHRRGIVHRDLKPSNVMLTTDGHVKVMDFGVAKQLAAAVAPALTVTGEIVGTMSYMSPEQIQGSAVDARSDVFAFGLLLYEMMAGAHPFERSSPITTAGAIVNEIEPPLEERRPEAPPLLAHIVSRCLEKDRNRRYQSLHDVKLELATLAEGTGSSSIRRPIVRTQRRTLWAIVGVAALGLAAVGGVSMWQRFSEPALAFQERDWVLISDFENLTDDQVFDRSLRLALEVSVGQSQHVNVFPPQSVQATLQRMERPPNDRLTEALASEVAVREGVKAVLAGSISRLGNSYALTARLIEPHSRAAVLSESVQVDGRDDVLDGLNDLGLRVRRRLGESLASISQKSLPLPKATTSSLEALKFYADSLMLDSRYSATSDALLRQAIELDPDFAMAHAELGRRLYLKPSRSTRLEAEQHIVKALALLDRLSPRERLWIQASSDDSRGERRKAADGYRAYLAQYPDDGRAWFRLGWTYMAGLREFDRAIDAFNHTIALSPRDASAHINLATSYTGLRQYERAAEMYGKAFSLHSDALFGEFVNHEYGFTLVHLGRLDEAAGVFTRMQAQTSSVKRARALRSMALLNMYRGRYASAIEGLREAILIDQSNGAGVSEFRDRMFLVRALDASGQTTDAAAELANVERLASTLTLAPEWLRHLAKAEARRGRLRQARQLADQMAERATDATADSATNRTIEFDPEHVSLARGECALAERKFDEAVRLLEAANVEQAEPDGLESLGAAYAAAGRLGDAAATYDAVITKAALGNEAQEDWLRTHATLGDIYERLNRRDDARKMYERLLTLWKDGDPDLVVLKDARARLARLAPPP